MTRMETLEIHSWWVGIANTIFYSWTIILHRVYFFFFFIPALFRFNVKVGHALWSPPKLNYLNARGFDRVRTHRDKSASCRSPSKGQWITRFDVEFSRNFSARWIFVSWHMERPSPTGCQFFSSISLWIVFIRLLQWVSSLQDSLLTSSVLRSAYLVSRIKWFEKCLKLR